MNPRCSMLGCKNTSTDFFKFPWSFYLCMLWVESCNQIELIKDFTSQGVKPFINKYVCSDHFKESDFLDPNCHDKGLKGSAVPVSATNYEDKPQNNVQIKREVIYVENSEGFAIDEDTNTQIRIQESLDEEKSVFIKEEASDITGLAVDYQNLQAALDTDSQQAGQGYALNDVSETSNESLEEQTRRKRANALRNAIKRANETEEERRDRRAQNAIRTAIRRSMETPEQQLARRRKNAERVALKRQKETEDLKELRRLKDRIRSAERRKRETAEQTQYRRYIDSLRSAFRRNNETEEQRQHRRQSDVVRSAKRKLNETPEQRQRRLQSDRERSARHRMFKKFADNIEQWCLLGSLSDNTSCRDNLVNVNQPDCIEICKNNSNSLNQPDHIQTSKDSLDNLNQSDSIQRCKDNLANLNQPDSVQTCRDSLDNVSQSDLIQTCRKSYG